MIENRRIARNQIGKAARVLTSTGDVLDCVVIDVTTIGACLAVPSVETLGHIFELSFDNFKTGLICRLVWIKDLVVGVEIGTK